jgi:hypothetical protein
MSAEIRRGPPKFHYVHRKPLVNGSLPAGNELLSRIRLWKVDCRRDRGTMPPLRRLEL